MKNDKNKDLVVMVLGEVWYIKYKTPKEDSFLEECAGYTDTSTRVIIIRECNQDDPSTLCDLNKYYREVIRHELIHAFLYECGLRADTNNDWAQNEEMVDFFAIQFPKFNKIFTDIGVDI